MEHSRGVSISENWSGARRPGTGPATCSVVPLDSAEELRAALSGSGISADVHEGYGLALVSVWVGLVVWCDGTRYWWRTGWDADRKRAIYVWHPAIEPVRAARRVAFRYADLARDKPLSTVIAESTQ